MLDTRVSIRTLEQAAPLVAVDRHGHVTWIGRRARAYLGVDHGALLGRPFDDVFPVGPEPPPGIRVHGAAEDADLRAFRVEWLENGAADRIAMLVDQTDVVRARRECLRLSRLAAAGRLISGIVHEINNPLSGIIGYSQLLALKELDAEAQRHVGKIHGEAQRTSRIVRNLLDFSRRREVKPTRVSVRAVIDKALDLKAHDLRVRNITTHFDMPDELPEIVSDPHQLLQVFVNLITNAEHAMHKADHGGRIAFSASLRGERVHVAMSDTGPGIPADVRPRVFEPFFTTKSEGHGTGLGLGLCREVLSRFESTIELGPPSDIGAEFLLSFPVANDRKHLDRGELDAPTTHVRGRRILVVEDDPVCRSLMVDAFFAENQVHAFDRSETALHFLERHFVDVIISDLHRPGLDGLEFLEQVRQFDEPLASRVLFLTGDTLNEQLAEAIGRTGNTLLAKPASIVDLRAAVARIVSRPANQQRTLFDMGGEEMNGGSEPYAPADNGQP